MAKHPGTVSKELQEWNSLVSVFGPTVLTTTVTLECVSTNTQKVRGILRDEDGVALRADKQTVADTRNCPNA